MNDMITPRRLKMSRTRSGSVDVTPNGRTSQPSKYRATYMWNNILAHFVNECPRKKHRRQLTTVDNSFTGKEAVDFLMDAIPQQILNGRPVSRENCTMLLQKFMEKNIFTKFRGNDDKEGFRDNATLYVFSDTKKLPKLIQNSTPTHIPCTVSKRIHRSPQCQQLCSPEWNSQRKAILVNSSPLGTNLNRRISMSTGNLPVCSLSEHEPVKDVAKSHKPPTPLLLIGKVIEENMDDPAKDLEGKSEVLYEWLSFGRRKKNKTKDELPNEIPGKKKGLPPIGSASRSSQKSKDSGRATLSSRTRSRPPPLPSSNSSSVMFDRRTITEFDIWKIWKECLVRRLKDILKITDLSFIGWEISGFDVKWNCEKIGSSGIVKPREDSDSFPQHIARMMRYLETFPFPSGSTTVITYKDDQEIRVFETLCENLRTHPSLLNNDEASALLHIISLCHESSDISTPLQECAARTPYESTSPVNRSIIRPFDMSDTSKKLDSDIPPAIRTNGIQDGTQLAFSTVSNENSCIATSPFLAGQKRLSASNRSPLTCLQQDFEIGDYLRLPGLRQSPQLLDRLMQMQSVISSSTDKPLSPSVSKLSPARMNNMTLACSYILLAISPSTRRKLHHVIRFLSKVVANHCLQLHPSLNNKDVVIEKFTPVIFPVDGCLSPVQAKHLLSLLLDNEVAIFSVDTNLRESFNGMCHEFASLGISATPPTNVQYCEKIQKEDYDRQTHSAQNHLLPILDKYISDPHLKESERERKLRQFKKSHPNVYAIRFPDERARKDRESNGFFRRLFTR